MSDATKIDEAREKLLADVKRAELQGGPIEYIDDNGFPKLAVGPMAERIARKRLAEYDAPKTRTVEEERRAAEQKRLDAERAAHREAIPAAQAAADKARQAEADALAAFEQAVADNPIVAAYVAWHAAAKEATRLSAELSDHRRQADGKQPNGATYNLAPLDRMLVNEVRTLLGGAR